MKRFFTLIVILNFISSWLSLKAQYVTIPDANFATWLQQHHPSCMNGNQLNPSCPDISNITEINISSKNISNIYGIQYFVSLAHLDCSYNQITTMPTLPNSLTWLMCANNQLTILPSLPSLTYLNFNNNSIANLPPLPNSLVALLCVNNQLLNLPNLPSGLTSLNCGYNHLLNLPTLPNGVSNLSCHYNQLSSLPSLPSGLSFLGCYNNQLSSLPPLPSGLTTLQCHYNQLSSLPPLPSSLTTLQCLYNQITSLPALPNGLTNLSCSSNQLTSLPTLPSGLTDLSCSNNQLTSLPTLPSSLSNLNCSNNPLSCLPLLNAALQYISLSGTTISCLPNIPASLIAASPSLPVCTSPCSCAEYTCNNNQLNDWSQTPSNMWKYKANGKANSALHWNNRPAIASKSISDGAWVLDADSLHLGNYSSPIHASLISPTMNIGQYASNTLFLSFHQYYRAYNSSTSVRYSFDGGATWTTRTINSNLLNHSETANYDYQIIPISIPAQTAQYDSIKIAFSYSGHGYFWILDDIKLCDTYPSPTLPDPALGAFLFYNNQNYEVDRQGHPYKPNEIVVKLAPSVSSAPSTINLPNGDLLTLSESCSCDTLHRYQYVSQASLVPYPALTGSSIGIEEKVEGVNGSTYTRSGEANYYIFNEINNGAPCAPNSTQALYDVSSLGVSVDNGSEYKVAILDTGVDFSNPNIATRISTQGLNSANGTANLVGINTIYGNNNPTDDHGHGTHVLGILLNTLNTYLPSACNIKFVVVKTHDNKGLSSLFSAACGMHCAINSGAKVINCSWGYYQDSIHHASILYDVIRKAQSYNIVVVASAGNDGIVIATPHLHIPSSYTGIAGATALNNVVSTTSSNVNAGISAFSNISNIYVDIAAPGEHVISNDLCGNASSRSGTSMSSPIISAAIIKRICDSPANTPLNQILNNVFTSCNYALPSNTTSTGSTILFPCCSDVLSITGNRSFCAGDSTILSAIGSHRYLWSTGDTTASIVVRTAGNYSFTATNIAGCQASASVTISVLTLPTPQIIGYPFVCTAASTTITATGGASYSWNTPDSATTPSITRATGGLYIVTATNTNGCSASASLSIVDSINPPIANISPSSTSLTCAINTRVLTAIGNQQYAWSNNTTGTQIAVNNPGIFIVTVTDTNTGCTASASAVVTNDTLPPTAGIISNTNVITCGTTSINLLSTNGASYLWSTGSTLSDIVIGQADTYRVTITGTNGCTASAQSVITSNTMPPTPSIISIGMQELTCTNSNVNLLASGGTSYVWSNGVTETSINVSTVGTYIVTVEASNGCTTSTSYLVNNNIVAPNIIITPQNPLLTCDQSSIMLIASTTNSGSTYHWSNNINTPSFSTSTAGVYHVTVTGANGCTASAVKTVSINTSPPNGNIVASSNLNCSNTSVTLSINNSNGVSYWWSNGTMGTSTTVTSAGSYTVTITGANGCTTSRSITVSSNTTAPFANISSPITNISCSNPSANLSATGGSNYVWNTGANTSSIVATTAGTYIVTVVASNGCTATASQIVTGSSIPPSLSISTNTMILDCVSAPTANLYATSNSSNVYFIWSNGITGSANTVLQAGTYSVTATDNNNCTSSSFINISGNATIPTISISSNNTILTCAQPNATLMANGSGTYLWSDGATTPVIVTNTSGLYSVTCSTSGNCSATASISITSDYTTPSVSIMSSDTAISCPNPLVYFTATGASSYVWSTGATTPTTPISTAGNYMLTATGSNGCTAIANQIITGSSIAPIVNITASQPQLSCAHPVLTLSASGGGTYQWSNGSSSNSIQVNTAGNYALTVTGANGCTATANKILSIDTDLPFAQISSSVDTITCNTPTSTLIATGGLSYIWSNGATGAALNVNTSGTYTVTVTNSNGCASVAARTISANQAPPMATISPSNSTLACNAPIILQASGGSNYFWSNGLGNSASATANTGGFFNVTVTGANGCSATASSIVNLPVLPSIDIETNALSLNCHIDEITLTTLNDSALAYNWSNNVVGNVNIISTPDIYTVTASNIATGCTASASINIPHVPTLSVTANAGGTNVSATAIVSGGTPPYSYTWSNGALTGANIINVPSGTYNVSITDANACTASASVDIINGISDLPDLLDFSIAPNPSSGLFHLNIAFRTAQDVRIDILGVDGRLIKNYKFDNRLSIIETIDITDLPANVYLLRISTASNYTGIRLIKTD